MKKDAIIIGGGVAGLWSAWELARLGLESVIVEKAPFLGGHVANFACKATDRCQRCGACLLEDIVQRVATSERITRLVRTTVQQIEPVSQGFSALLLNRPARILPERCTSCDACEEVCPEPSAISRAPGGDRMVLDEDRCRRFRGDSCRACADVCPEGAVDLDRTEDSLQVDASTVILATGFQPFDPLEKQRFAYGRVPGVVTALEVDTLIRHDNWPGNGTGEALRSAAFIQCVGSRDPRIGRNYCSRVCCGYALRLARLMKKRIPSLEVSMHYMDIQTFDRDFDRRLAEAAKEVRLIRSIPAEIRASEDGRPELIYHGPDERKVVEAVDVVVLSIGISQGLPFRLLPVPLNADGFLGPDGEAVRTAVKGLFVAGAAQGPRSIDESVSHAIRAAAAAAAHIRGER